MSKKLAGKENFRVAVYPRSLGNLGAVRVSDRFLHGDGPDAAARIARAYEERCEEIAAQIKRHADNVGVVVVEFDQPEVCEHCGYTWGETSATYNGGCCEKDEEGAPVSPEMPGMEGTRDALANLTVAPQ